ncbi:MAG: MerR family transcriptional regulator [Myxococcota bacterium]|jgi:DNA-binding transcriptional MerR regulator|nr:MerR family transcriptional regulator [Myxococcota bacterium]
MEGRLSIGELADLAGISRRTVRYYVQRELLPPPLGLGRGRHYDQSHLQALQRLLGLQQQGLSLEEIARHRDAPPPAPDPAGEAPPAEAGEPPGPPPAPEAPLAGEPYRRLRLLPGVELHLRPELHALSPEQLARLIAFVRSLLSQPR